MFDIGFMELVLIAIVALLVVGPEKLPGAIRTGALWVGRAKRSFNQVRADIEREINADDIRRQLHNESILADIEKAKKGADKLISDTKKDLDSLSTDVNSTLTREKKELDEVLQEGTQETKQESKQETRKEPKPKTETEAKVMKETPDPEPLQTSTEPDSSVSIDPEDVTESKPIEDFYNTPPSGIVRLQGGVFQQVVADEEDGDQKPQRKS